MRRRTIAVGAVVLAGAALVLFCCGGHGDRPATTPSEPSATAATARAAPPSPSATADASAANNAGASVAAGSTKPGDASSPKPSDAGAAPAGSARPSGPGALIADTVHTADPRDLELLASIERDVKRDPPPEIHALIAARKRGATRDELTRDIRALPDLRLRVLVMRWLNAVAPADAGVP